jgi:hypothetical protein
MNRPTTTKLQERRRQVANYVHKGWTQVAIARHMNIPQATVSRDLAAMREYWREFPVYDFEKVRFEQLQKIDLIEAEAWAAWQRSQEQQRSASITRGKAGETSRTSLKDQSGDSRFLREVARCVAQRYEMIGVKPPEPPPPDNRPPPPSIDQYPLFFRTFLRLKTIFGDPPYADFGGLTAEQIAAMVAAHERDPYPTDRVNQLIKEGQQQASAKS